MSGKASMQDEYLKKTIANRTPVRVLLVNGKDLRGLIKSCDAFTLILDIGGVELLVYKSAVAVLGPQSQNNE
jgi:host factor-I protein